MASTATTNDYCDTVLIVSSDEEDEKKPTDSRTLSTPSKSNITVIKDEFFTLLTLFGKRLKDEKRLKILCKMYNAASCKFTSSEEFKRFVKEIIIEIEDNDDKEHALLLMTSVCQTLGLKEIMWSPKKKKKITESKSEQPDSTGSPKTLKKSEISNDAEQQPERSIPTNDTATDHKPKVVLSALPAKTTSQVTTDSICPRSTSELLENQSDDKLNKTPLEEKVSLHAITNIHQESKSVKKNDSAKPMSHSNDTLDKNKKLLITKNNPRVVLNFDRKKIEMIAKKLREKNLRDKNKLVDKQYSASTTNCKITTTENTISSGNVGNSSTRNNPQSKSSSSSKNIKQQAISKEATTGLDVPIIVLDDDDGDIIHSQLSPKVTQKIGKSSKVKPVKLLSKKLKIRKLEKTLEVMERQILAYSEQELSFKDMESDESAYMQEAKLKEQFVKTWRRYCRLVGEDADEIVATRKKIKVISSPFPEINRAVAKYVNRTGNFPNLFEIKQVCLQANDKYKLELKPNDLHHCAVDVFTEVGRKLQKNREKDFRQTCGNVLTDQIKLQDDPAISDTDLKRRLKHNRKLAKQRTEKVFTDFVRQQFEQETAGGGIRNTEDSEDSDAYENTLESLRKNDLIGNKQLKRELINKNANMPATKKKRNDQTVISVTVSSSQEHLEPLSNQKVDYRVTIDSPLANVQPPKSKKKTKSMTPKRLSVPSTISNNLNELSTEISAITPKSNKVGTKTAKSAFGQISTNTPKSAYAKSPKHSHKDVPVKFKDIVTIATTTTTNIVKTTCSTSSMRTPSKSTTMNNSSQSALGSQITPNKSLSKSPNSKTDIMSSAIHQTPNNKTNTTSSTSPTTLNSTTNTNISSLDKNRVNLKIDERKRILAQSAIFGSTSPYKAVAAYSSPLRMFRNKLSGDAKYNAPVISKKPEADTDSNDQLMSKDSEDEDVILISDDED